MLNMIVSHPFVAAFVGWVALIGLFLFLLWRRNGGRSVSPELEDPEFDGISFCAAAMRDGLMRRLDMRPRFLRKEYDPQRSDLMAAQILADQANVQEDPGKPTHAPAPGEKGHREPIRAFRVSVGQFEVILRREGVVSIVETTAAGGVSPPYPVPEPWAELVSAMAFEIGKLRA